MTTISKSTSLDRSKIEGSAKSPKAKQVKSIKIDVIDSNPAQDRGEVGGRNGLEPTRYGDWEKNGRCIDF